MRILTLCGSLRTHSSHRAILRAYERVAAGRAEFDHYPYIAALPHFNPDLDREDGHPPQTVLVLRKRIAEADAVVISTPEYAHALPGSFKNALDWLVSDPAFAGKPVAILDVSYGSTWALDSLKEVLRTMSAKTVEAACVSLPLKNNRVNEDSILANEELRGLLHSSFESLLHCAFEYK